MFAGSQFQKIMAAAEDLDARTLLDQTDIIEVGFKLINYLCMH